MKNIKSDFCITIDFKKESNNPARVFQTMTQLINSFQELDKDLISGIDSKLEPTILLEDVEIGSLKTWLSEQIKGIPDELIKEADWKKLIGHYLVKAKYIIVNKLDGKTEITDAKEIQLIQDEIHEVAKETNVLDFPAYTPLPMPKLINHIDKLNKSLSNLDQEDKAYFESRIDGKANFNLTLNFTPESIEKLLTKESLTNESTTILKVKKPDYLGTSMWEFRDSHKSIPVKMLDESWVVKFQKRKVDIRPGDSLRVKLKTTVNYGHDNQAISTHYEVVKVIEILPLNNADDQDMFV